MEIDILKSLQSSDGKDWNKVQMKDDFVHNDQQCIVFELLQHNLYEILQFRKFQGLPLHIVRVIGRQILKSLFHLSNNIHTKSSLQILHCDLKPENILLRRPKKTKIKVIDFSSACYSNHTPHTYIQSRFYRSPEILFGAEYSTAIDMFSLGCILYEMRSGIPLFPGSSEQDQILKQINVLGMPPKSLLKRANKVDKFFDYYIENDTYIYINESNVIHEKIEDLLLKNSNSQLNADFGLFVNLIEQMLQWDPNERITPINALKHPFFASRNIEQQPQQAKQPQPSTSSSSPWNSYFIF